MERIFELDLQLVVDAVIIAVNMLALFIAGSYFLFNPVRDFLQKRKDMVQDTIEKANADKQAAGELKEEYEARLRDINKEADEILSVARKKALAREEQIIEEAKEEARRIVERANNEAELEKKRVADEVKQEIVNVASAVAGKVIAGNMNVSVQQSLVDETLNEMGDGTWQS